MVDKKDVTWQWVTSFLSKWSRHQFMADYKPDRTAFRMMTFSEADAANVFDKNISYLPDIPFLCGFHYVIGKDLLHLKGALTTIFILS